MLAPRTGLLTAVPSVTVLSYVTDYCTAIAKIGCQNVNTVTRSINLLPILTP